MFSTTQSLEFFVGILNYIKDPVIITFVTIFLMRHYVKKTESDKELIYNKIKEVDSKLAGLTKSLNEMDNNFKLNKAILDKEIETIDLIKKSLLGENTTTTKRKLR